MPYIKEVCVAGDTIEVCKYYTYRANVKGERRARKGKPTSEAQKRVNQRKAEKNLRRLMAENFKNGDVLVRLDFAKRPGGSEEMQKLMAKALRELREEYSRAEKPLKYIYVKEIGPRGSRHIHMLLSRDEGMDVLKVLMKCWPYGGIHVDPWTTGPNFTRLASYFIKYAAKTEETEGKLIGKRWYASRNLDKPKVTKEIIRSNRFREEVREKKGYTLDQDSVQSGVSNFTGYRYFSYTLIRTEKEEEKRSVDRVNLYTYTTIRGPGIRSGSYTYLLEYVTEKGPATLTKQGELEQVTENQAHLKIIIEALKRIKKSCEVMVYTDSRYLQQGAEHWLKDWKAAGWMTARGKPVANRKEWEKAAGLLERHLISFQVGGHHSYRSWIQVETEKKEKERKKCLRDLENLTAQRK